MTDAFLYQIRNSLTQIETDGMTKRERLITSPQSGNIAVGGRQVINLCANNYLGLADNPDLIKTAKSAMDTRGFGMASVRFICGTQDIHRALEQRLAKFLNKDDAILFAACFDANGGLFEPLLGAEDAIVSDSLNHASIIDGIRLCKAQRYRYANSDMDDLETQLKAARAAGARHIMIATDGVFSMDGVITRIEGLILIVYYVAYLVTIIVTRSEIDEEGEAVEHLSAGRLEYILHLQARRADRGARRRRCRRCKTNSPSAQISCISAPIPRLM